jgi:hypothetical protein
MIPIDSGLAVGQGLPVVAEGHPADAALGCCSGDDCPTLIEPKGQPVRSRNDFFDLGQLNRLDRRGFLTSTPFSVAVMRIEPTRRSTAEATAQRTANGTRRSTG